VISITETKSYYTQAYSNPSASKVASTFNNAIIEMQPNTLPSELPYNFTEQVKAGMPTTYSMN